jgi:hypothetical protein
MDNLHSHLLAHGMRLEQYTQQDHLLLAANLACRGRNPHRGRGRHHGSMRTQFSNGQYTVSPSPQMGSTEHGGVEISPPPPPPTGPLLQMGPMFILAHDVTHGPHPKYVAKWSTLH